MLYVSYCCNSDKKFFTAGADEFEKLQFCVRSTESSESMILNGDVLVKRMKVLGVCGVGVSTCIFIIPDDEIPVYKLLTYEHTYNVPSSIVPVKETNIVVTDSYAKNTLFLLSVSKGDHIEIMYATLSNLVKRYFSGEKLYGVNMVGDKLIITVVTSYAFGQYLSSRNIVFRINNVDELKNLFCDN